MERPWVQVYDEYNDDSGYEHVNPNVLVNAHISSGDDEELIMVLAIDINGNVHTYDFTTVKEAQRFINRLGGLNGVQRGMA